MPPEQSSPPDLSPRHFYDTAYHFAEDAARPDERRMWRALRHLQPLAGTTILDLGCGAGWGARLAVQGGAGAAVGVDFSRTALELARRHSPEILWVQADGSALPLADESVDRLFCNGALEHFPSVRRGLGEIARVLRPGGVGVVIVPNFYVKTEQPMEFAAHWWAWRRLMREAGLEVTKTAADWGPPVFRNADPKRILARLIGKCLCLIPRMQYQFVFVVTRGSRRAAA